MLESLFCKAVDAANFCGRSGSLKPLEMGAFNDQGTLTELISSNVSVSPFVMLYRGIKSNWACTLWMFNYS